MLFAFMFEFVGDVNAGSSQAPSSLVEVVATFPKNSHQEFVKRMQKFVQEKQKPAIYRFDLSYTMGDPANTEKILSKFKQEQPTIIIFLDVNSALALDPLVSTPSIVIASSELKLKGCNFRSRLGSEQSGRTGTAEYSDKKGSKAAWILETTPNASTIIGFLRAIKPPPKEIGVVFINGDTGHENLLKELGSSLRPSNLVKCSLPGVSCNNATAIEQIVQKSFEKLSTGSLVLVLPGNNTLKFPYVFEQYAAKHRLAIATLGDFSCNRAIFHIGCTPETLAEACSQILSTGRSKNGVEHPGIFPVQYLLTIDSNAMSGLGYSLRSDWRQRLDSRIQTDEVR